MGDDAARKVLEKFQWTPQPRAEAWVAELSVHVRGILPAAERMKQRLLAEAGVRFDDMIDTVFVIGDAKRVADAVAAGWVRSGEDCGYQMYSHPGGVFPQIAAREGAVSVGLDLKVESIEDFLAAWELKREIVGEVGKRWRWASIEKREGAEVGIVQRLGWRGLCTDEATIDVRVTAEILEGFRGRRRDFDDSGEGFAAAEKLIDGAIAKVGRDVACQLFFMAEREFWMGRNRAAQAQYARQARLGIGWANHDHHTYRSSRAQFQRLIGLWEKLGLVCRERFYAGREAGWGAQVMENAVTGIITFNDVDLSPDELLADFAHEPLSPRQSLGTVGLWCGLHGEAFLQAGMHHLEAQFAFDALRDQLAAENIHTMKPFTNFAHLKQAFTEGERWAVPEKNIACLLAARLITPDQAAQFRATGAIGSHLENLERNDGFKGFNQTGVSQIIAATDPRNHLGTAAPAQ